MGDESPEAPAYSPPREPIPSVAVLLASSSPSLSPSPPPSSSSSPPSASSATSASVLSPLKRRVSEITSESAANVADDTKRRRIDDDSDNNGNGDTSKSNGGVKSEPVAPSPSPPRPVKEEASSSFVKKEDDDTVRSQGASSSADGDEKTSGGADGDDGDNATPEEAQREEEAAIACGLTGLMSPEEAEHVSGATDDPESYIQIRNILCDLWQQDVTGFVSTRILSDKFVEKHMALARATFQYLEQFGYINCGLTNRTPNPRRDRQRVIVIGAGASGLMAARQLHNFGHRVTVLEGRDRVGGRVCTETSKFSGPVELGASIVNGWVRNPITVLGRQIEARATKRPAEAPWVTTTDADQQKNPLPKTFHALMPECPIYDLSGRKLAEDIDTDMQTLWDTLLDGCETMRAPLRAAQVSAAEAAAAAGASSSSSSSGANGTPIARSSSNGPSTPSTASSPSAAAASTVSSSSSPLDTGATSNSTSEATVPAVSAATMSITSNIINHGSITGMDTTSDGLIRRPTVDVRTPEGLDMNKVNLDQGTRITRDQIVEGRGRVLSKQEECTLNWHRANLEYANATPLDQLSILNWDQDDGLEWTGVHTLIKPGYGSMMRSLANGLDVKLGQNVANIEYNDSGVIITTHDGIIYEADIVVVTLPLGVLKAKSVTWQPELPTWKTDAIERLGFGLLNKLVMEFDEAWWKDRPDVDMFGVLIDDPVNYGRFFQFWNIERVIHKPVLVALVAGNAAHSFETEDEAKSVRDCLQVLRRVWPAAPDPITTHCTRWKADPFARGSYSYIPPGATGEDYDLLARPIGRRVFFAGEGTNRKNPATVPGALLTGLRVAGTIELTGPHALPGGNLISSSHRLVRMTRHVDLAALTERLRRNRARHQRPHMASAPVPTVSDDELKREESARLALFSRLDSEADQLLSGPKGIFAMQLAAAANKDGHTNGNGSNGNGDTIISSRAIASRATSDNPFGAKAANLGDLPTVLSFADFDSNRTSTSSSSSHRSRRTSSSSAAGRPTSKKRTSVRRRKDDKKRPSSSSSSAARKPSSSASGGDEKRSSSSAPPSSSAAAAVPSSSSAAVPSSTGSKKDKLKKKKKKDGTSKSSSKKDKKDKKGSKKGGAGGAVDDATKTIASHIRHILKEKFGHPAASDREKFKTVAKKAVERVVTDWTTKKRTVTVQSWLDEKKAKISSLVDTYAPRYGIGAAAGTASTPSAPPPSSSPVASSHSAAPPSSSSYASSGARGPSASSSSSSSAAAPSSYAPYNNSNTNNNINRTPALPRVAAAPPSLSSSSYGSYGSSSSSSQQYGGGSYNNNGNMGSTPSPSSSSRYNNNGAPPPAAAATASRDSYDRRQSGSSSSSSSSYPSSSSSSSSSSSRSGSNRDGHR